MNNKNLYQRTFSHVHSSSKIRWEDYSMQKKHFVMGNAAAVLIVAALVILMSGTALAANFLGLRDLLLPQSPRDSDGTLQSISLSGYMNTPESQALKEWQAFLSGYDQDQGIFNSSGDRLDDSLARYSCYKIYAPEMARELTRIADKYSLKLHTTLYDLDVHPELRESLGNFMGTTKGWLTYMYEDGTFHVDNGWIEFEDFGAMDFQLQRSVRGTFHDAMLVIGNVSDYQEWNYEAADGSAVTLAIGPDTALIICDLEDCFVTVIAPCGANQGFSQTNLETLADSINFTALSPVEVPVVERQTVEITEDALNRDMAARETYAAILRNLLYSGVLPDGTITDDGYHSGSSAQFAVRDVDGDGKEELVLLYDPGITAFAVGYIIGYDQESGTPRVELAECPYFQFYTNGAIKALWSHNQGYGEMWPYNLYEYQPDSDSYIQVGEVDSWNKEYKEEDFPDDIDTDGTGVVYYVNEDPYQGGQPISEADYQAWLEPYLQGASELDITYQYLYDENIAAIVQ